MLTSNIWFPKAFPPGPCTTNFWSLSRVNGNFWKNLESWSQSNPLHLPCGNPFSISLSTTLVAVGCCPSTRKWGIHDLCSPLVLTRTRQEKADFISSHWIPITREQFELREASANSSRFPWPRMREATWVLLRKRLFRSHLFSARLIGHLKVRLVCWKSSLDFFFFFVCWIFLFACHLNFRM